MYDVLSVSGFYLNLANMVIALYILKMAYDTKKNLKGKMLCKLSNLLMSAIAVFFFLELASALNIISAEGLQFVRSLVIFVFMAILITMIKELKKSLLLHDLMIKQRFKGKTSDVE